MNKITARWFEPYVRIMSLEISDEFINEIEPNAFDTTSFEQTTILIISMPLEILHNDTFNGFYKLAVLELHSMKLKAVETGALHHICITLEHFRSNRSNFEVTALKKLVGSLSETTVLISIKMNNALNRITKDLFRHLKNITFMSLGFNRITDIERNSFDTFAETLTTIDLAANLLTTLPEGVLPLQLFAANKRTHVYLSANAWHCSCNMEYLKQLIIRYRTHFLWSPLCATPIRFRKRLIADVDLCNSDDLCPLRKLLLPSFLLQPMRFYTNLSNEFILTINSTLNDYCLLWLEADASPSKSKPIQMSKCVMLNTHSFEALNFTGNLKPNKIFTFCLLKRFKRTVHPLNCVSLYTQLFQPMPNAWIPNVTINIIFIIALSLFSMSAFLSGTVVVYILARSVNLDAANDGIRPDVPDSQIYHRR